MPKTNEQRPQSGLCRSDPSQSDRNRRARNLTNSQIGTIFIQLVQSVRISEGVLYSENNLLSLSEKEKK